MITGPTPPPNVPAAAATVVDILVVDDVAENLVAMRALLTRPDMRVLTARSGREALELLLVHEVALALLDVQMPEMDGFALAELMRGAERTRDVPIIFLTAEPSDSARSFRGYEAGAVDFLNKPVDQRVIESKVGVFVELFRQRRELSRSNTELRQAIDLNATMTAVLTHDLRSPLSAITTGAEVALLAADRGQADTLRSAILRIRNSGQRMGRMIAQLLDFSQIRSGTMRLAVQDADLGEVCNAVVEEVALGRSEARIEVSASGDLRGRFDADRLSQVFTNLLGNALEHGADDVVRVRLDGRDVAWLYLEVDNRGELSAEARQRLFVPFRGREDNSRQGLGLGLYIVDQFVRAHGGEVSGRSAEGRTVFALRLPRQGAAA